MCNPPMFSCCVNYKQLNTEWTEYYALCLKFFSVSPRLLTRSTSNWKKEQEHSYYLLGNINLDFSLRDLSVLVKKLLGNLCFTIREKLKL